MAAKLAHPLMRSTMALAAVLAAIIPVAGSAHHSTAAFAWGQSRTLRGAVVTRWDWTNPHTFLFVRVSGAGGKLEDWAFEGMSPNHLRRGGWTRATVKPGDRIDLTYFPLKDGRKGGFNVTITLNGKTWKQLEAPDTRPDQDR